MNRRIGFGLIIMLLSLSAAAHHSSASHYLLSETIEIEGVVTEFKFVSPHMRLFVNVTNAQGDAESWAAEGTTTVLARRQGWTNETFRPGEKVKVIGHPGRNGRKMIEWVTITKADGTEYGGGNNSSVAAEEAERRRR